MIDYSWDNDPLSMMPSEPAHKTKAQCRSKIEMDLIQAAQVG